jgi:acyl-coenzyme A synthetase/AMP-(fatty) acid ligase
VMLSGLLPHDSVRALLQRVEPKLLVSNNRLLLSRGSDGSSLSTFAERTLRLDEGEAGADTIAYADVYGSSDPAPVSRGADELMMLTHTSGTTGIPKLIMYTPEKLQARIGATTPWRCSCRTSTHGPSRGSIRCSLCRRPRCSR